ncbi:AgrD family cyclic lactone autoinducer peptide [Paenibacillus campi]|nr:MULTISPECIES: cyclic lactone autoinducer peptide [unclassified Paenibacillus]
MKKTYFLLANCLSALALFSVSLGSFGFVFNPEPPEELLK